MTDFNQEHDPESRRERQSTQFCAECENWARKADELRGELAKVKGELVSDKKLLEIENKRLREALLKYGWHRSAHVEYCNCCNCRWDDHAYDCELKQALEAK